MQAFFGACAGLCLGVASRAGSLPKLSHSKLLLLLSVQSAIASTLNIAGECFISNCVEWTGRDARFPGFLRQEGVNIELIQNFIQMQVIIPQELRDQLINWMNVHGQGSIDQILDLAIPVGRRGFCDCAAGAGMRYLQPPIRRNVVLSVPMLSAAIAQVLALWLVIPEFIIARIQRDHLKEQRIIELSDSLKELQEILDKAKYDVELAALLAEEAN